jgi:hypothetical protein
MTRSPRVRALRLLRIWTAGAVAGAGIGTVGLTAVVAQAGATTASVSTSSGASHSSTSDDETGTGYTTVDPPSSIDTSGSHAGTAGS